MHWYSTSHLTAYTVSSSSFFEHAGIYCSYYEQPLPYKNFEFGMKDVLQTKKDGFIYAPTKPGLGMEIDWDKMSSKIIYSITCDVEKNISQVHG